jgi:RNA polymerase sigma-70 factor (sigma-E family)
LGEREQAGTVGIRSGRLERRSAACEAVIELYRDHYSELARFARLLVRDAGAAEDIVQEAFAKLYSSWHRVREPERAVGYLRVTILNLARGRARRNAVAQRHEPDPANDVASAEDDAMGAAARQQVIDAIQHLSSRQRECLVMRYYRGLTESEIAEQLGCSVGSVRTHLKRGMANLEEQLRAREAEVVA